MKAFHYMDEENKIAVDHFKECAKAVKLHMFAIILRASYDRERKLFSRPESCRKRKLFSLAKLWRKLRDHA